MEIKGQYLAYQEYKGLGGTLGLTPFNMLEFKARKEIDDCTFGRLKNLKSQVQDVKLCIMELIDKIKKYNEVDNGKSSESVGSYSVSYNSDIKKIIEDKRAEIQDLILTDLYGVVYNGEHVLYCGV